MTLLRLRPYQVEGARFLAARSQAGLFLPPGTGKSVVALAAVPRAVPVVVVGPSISKANWLKHAALWRPDLRGRVVVGTRSFRWPKAGELAILNYEVTPPAAREVQRLRSKLVSLGVPRTPAERATQAKLAHKLHRLEAIRKRLTNPWPGTVLILDEAHRCKSSKARCTLRAREMAALVVEKRGRVWILTGTPYRNRAAELWTVLEAAGLGRVAFGSKSQFEAACKVDGAVAQSLRAVSLRRRREDILPELPAKTREVVEVPIDLPTRGLCDALVAELRRRGVQIETATLEQIKRAQEDAQVAEHVAQVRAALAVAKMPGLIELVHDLEVQGVPLVVFCCHRAPVDFLAKRRGWTCVTGDQSAAEKFARAEAFQRGQYHGVALTTRSGGEAIDLFRAWRCIFVDEDFTPAANEQAQDRLCRIGQTAKGLLYTILVADHVWDRRVTALLSRKSAESSRLVDASARSLGEVGR